MWWESRPHRRNGGSGSSSVTATSFRSATFTISNDPPASPVQLRRCSRTEASGLRAGHNVRSDRPIRRSARLNRKTLAPRAGRNGTRTHVPRRYVAPGSTRRFDALEGAREPRPQRTRCQRRVGNDRRRLPSASKRRLHRQITSRAAPFVQKRERVGPKGEHAVVVRAGRLELPPLSRPGPKPGASACFATLASLDLRATVPTDAGGSDG